MRGCALLPARDLRAEPELRAAAAKVDDRPGHVGVAGLVLADRPNVLLETEPSDRITKTGIRTGDGMLHKLDVLVLATGFRVFEHGNVPAFPIQGAGGVDLDQWWDEKPLQAYEGVSVPGFRASSRSSGPTVTNGSSYFSLIESQSRHIVRVLTRARRERATRVE